MIQKKSGQERRRDPRLDKNVPVKICLEDGDLVTETANLSRSGAYCLVSSYLEPMTKMKIHLLLPVKKNDKTSTKKISCQGVIVRTEPISGSDNCNVAIFFNDITQRDADTIADYISAYMEQNY